MKKGVFAFVSLFSISLLFGQESVDSLYQSADSSRSSIFELLQTDPYLKNYGRKPGEGWIPLFKTRTELKFSGFIQLNMMYDDAQTNFPVGSFATYEIVVPSDRTGNFEFDPRSSRITFETRTNNEKVGAVRTVFDMDLYNNFDGPFIGLRIRQAYVTFVHHRSHIAFTAGRAFTTFVDLSVWPAIGDLQGPNAMTGLRQGLVRASYDFKGKNTLIWDLALEQPETAVQQGKGFKTMPDIVTRLNFQKKWGHIAAMGLARRLQASNEDGDGKDSQLGYGVSFSGSFYVPGTSRKKQVNDNLGRRQDLIQFQVQGGKGTGRYNGDLGFSSIGEDGVYDTLSSQLRTLPQFGFFVAYKHWWTPMLMSTIVYSQEQVNNLDIQSGENYHHAKYILANLVLRVFKRMDLALEYIQGRRVNKNEQEGVLNRYNLVINYGF